MFSQIAIVGLSKRLVAAMLAGTIVSGCATHPAESSYTLAQPQQTPVSTVTNFTESLHCMDDMFLRSNYTYGVPITSVGLPDRTLKINAGTRDMIIGAISAMSLRSGAFRYIDLDKDISTEVFVAPQLLARGLFIRGSISQLDEGIVDDSVGAGLTVSPAVGLGFSKQQMVSLMTVDMSLGDAATRVILAPSSVSNSLAIARRTKGADLDARVGSVGLNYDVNLTESEGSHAGLRALIELSMIEMIGRYTKLPYWQCLGLAANDPRARTIAFDQYSALRDDQRAAIVASGLKSAGYYNGPGVTTLTPDLRAAAARYEQDNSLTPTGLMTFELYFALANGPGIVAIAPPQPAAAAAAPPAQVPVGTGPFIALSRESASRDGVYQGEVIRFTADLSRDGYMACFYQDGDGKLFRAFPNPQQPGEFLRAGRKVLIPGAGDHFRIHPSTVGQVEQFACFSSSRSVLAGLPPAIGQAALAVLPITMDSLKQQLASVLGSDLYLVTNAYEVKGDPK